jgi:hypothetical protein
MSVVRQSGEGERIAIGPVITVMKAADQDVRFLNVQTPGGFEGYLREMSEAMAGGDYDPEAAMKIAAGYDIRYPGE